MKQNSGRGGKRAGSGRNPALSRQEEQWFVRRVWEYLHGFRIPTDNPFRSMSDEQRKERQEQQRLMQSVPISERKELNHHIKNELGVAQHWDHNTKEAYHKQDELADWAYRPQEHKGNLKQPIGLLHSYTPSILKARRWALDDLNERRVRRDKPKICKRTAKRIWDRYKDPEYRLAKAIDTDF